MLVVVMMMVLNSKIQRFRLGLTVLRSTEVANEKVFQSISSDACGRVGRRQLNGQCKAAIELNGGRCFQKERTSNTPNHKQTTNPTDSG
jgi:hypothetical protein